MSKIGTRIQKRTVPLAPSIPLKTPFVLFVDPSSVCNMRCKFCYHSEVPSQVKWGVMKLDLFYKIIDDVRNGFEQKIKALRFYGFGEPLLNKRFAEMVRYAKDANVAEKIDTTTNGNRLNPKLNNDIIDAGIDRINISVDGVSAEHYKNFSRYNINFKKYVENITHLYENKKQCTVFVKINIDTVSEEDVSRFKEIFAPISDGMGFEHVMNPWNGLVIKDVKVNENVNLYGNPVSHIDMCPYIFYLMQVQYDGVVSACSVDWNRNLVIGNVNDTPVIDIWNAPMRRQLQKIMAMRRRDVLYPCKKCGQLTHGQPDNIDFAAEEILKRL